MTIWLYDMANSNVKKEAQGIACVEEQHALLCAATYFTKYTISCSRAWSFTINPMFWPAEAWSMC